MASAGEEISSSDIRPSDVATPLMPSYKIFPRQVAVLNPPNQVAVVESTLPTLAGILFAFSTAAFLAFLLLDQSWLSDPLSLWWPWQSHASYTLPFSRYPLISFMLALAAILQLLCVTAAVDAHLFHLPENITPTDQDKVHWERRQFRSIRLAFRCYNLGVWVLPMAFVPLAKDRWLIPVVTLMLLALVAAWTWRRQ